MSPPVIHSTLICADQRFSPELQQSRASRLAGGLRQLGFVEGDVVAVHLKNCAQYADVVHACRIAGIYYCPINWHFTAAEINFIVQDSGAKAFISSQELLAPLSENLDRHIPWLVVGAANHGGAHDYEQWLEQQAPYNGPLVTARGHMAYTSGTTGRPKGVIRLAFPAHEQAERQATNKALVQEAYGLRAGARTLLTAPIYHSAPTLYFQNALLLSELVVLTSKFDAEQFLQIVQEHRIDAAYMVPIMYVRLLRLPAEIRQKYDLSSLKFIASTGSPCAPEIKKAMIEWLGPIINETYASSEAGLITFISAPEALSHPGSAGRPLRDARVQILDADRQPLPVGEVGHIYVHQPAYADFTYKGNAEARQKIAHDGMITLGDMGYLDSDGYLYVCDRDSDMVISGGVNIYPAEIENELLRHAHISDCAVIGIPDAEYGEKLHAIIESSQPSTEFAAELKDWLKTRLATYKVPRSIEFRQLPRDENGKIAKRKLRDAYWASQQRKV